MLEKLQSRGVALLLPAMLVALVGCSSKGSSDPRKVVMSFFGAMERDDQATLAHLLDLAELMKNTEEDYAVQTDHPRVFTNPKEILDDLTGDGRTKQLWFKHQRIVNEAAVMGDHATVEVTFIDKESSRGYMTKFGLHRVSGKWKIYSFKTFAEGG
jgi:hypothetical protein